MGAEAGSVQELVQKLKNGEISKQQMLEQLTRLQQKQRKAGNPRASSASSAVTQSSSLPAAAPQEPVRQQPAAPAPETRSGSEGAGGTDAQREMLAQLIEEKKRMAALLQERQQKELESAGYSGERVVGQDERVAADAARERVEAVQQQVGATEGFHTPHEDEEQTRAYEQAQHNNSRASNTPQRNRPGEQVYGQNSGTTGTISYYGTGSGVQTKSSSHYKQVAYQNRENYSQSYLSKRTTDNRVEQAEEAANRAMEENCTFTPQITPLPMSYQSRNSLTAVPFVDRARKWQEQKAAETERLRQQLEDEKLQECSFEPHIDKSQAHRQPKDRRYTSVADRLHAQNPKDKVTQQVMQRKKEEEEEFKKTCTFKPDTTLAKRTHQSPVTSRYRSPSPNPRQHLPSGLEHCTFTPQTNKLKKNMASAQMYLESDAFERLSRPAATPRAHRQQSTDRSRAPGSERRPQSARAHYGRQPDFYTHAADRSVDVVSQDDSSARRNADFNQFLERQNISEVRRQQKLRQLKSQVEDKELTFNPQRSTSVSRSKKTPAKSSGTFLDRVQQEVMRKQTEFVKKKRELQQEQECTFKPKINPTSQARRGRSVDELSMGDWVRKQMHQKELKMRAAQRELEGATFRPNINDKDYGAQSRLKITTEPDTYLDRVQHEQKLQKERLDEVGRQKVRKETEQCTFRPQINDAPAYVKRIAKSMQITREAKAREQPPRAGKPAWV